MNETMVETEVTYTLAHEGKFYISYLAFTDAVWRKEDPPTEVKASFDSDHPTMGWVDDVLVAIANHGFELIDHFTLPDEAWWNDFIYGDAASHRGAVRQVRQRCRST